MEQSKSPAYQFTAFISYKRGGDDEKYARWLQARLESFRIPTEIAPGASGAERRFRVFRDKTDLGSHAELRDGLHKSLEQCRYLILVCSPKSASSPYVDAEVRWFQENGRADAIIPFIIAGTPAPQGDEEQCYPPSLSAEALGITLAEGNREEALLKVVARLLCVDFHALYQRHLRAQRRFMARLAAGLTLVLALVAGLGVWAVTAERRATAQRKEAEELVRFMTFDLRDEAFQYIPVRAREQISQKVEDYYQRWGARTLEARYTRAIHLGNRVVRLVESGDLAGAEALLADVLSAVTALRAELPDDTELLRMEVVVRSSSTNLAAIRGRQAAEARKEAEYGLGLAEDLLRKRPDDPAALRALAAMEENASRALYLAGNFDESLRHAEAAVAQRRDLSARYPQNDLFAQEYLTSLDALCSTLAQSEKASPAYDALIAIYREAGERDPHNLELRLKLSGALGHKTVYLFRKQKYNEALPLHRENLSILQDLLARDPDNNLVRPQLALSRALEAIFGALEGRPAAETTALLTQAEADLATVAEKDRGNLTWVQARNVINQTKTLLEAQRDQEKQNQALLADLQKTEKLLAADPGNVRLALEFADVARSAALHLRDGPQRDLCLGSLETAAASLRSLLKAAPGNKKLREELLRTLVSLAETERAGKNFAAAKAVGEEARTLLDGFRIDPARDGDLADAAAEVMDALGKVFYDMDDIRGALGFFEKHLALRRLQSEGGGGMERLQLVDALDKAGGAMLDMGQDRAGIALVEEAVRVSRQAVADPSLMLMGLEPFMLASALHTAAVPALDYGRFDAAAAALDEARALLGKAPGADMMRKHWRKLSLAVLARRAGLDLLRADPAAALFLLEQAAVFDGRTPEENGEIAAEFTPGDRWDLLLAEALLASGRVEEARSALKRAQMGMFPPDLEKTQENLLGGAAAARLDALLLLREGKAAEAVAACDRVLRVLEARARTPEAGVFYSREYLRLLSARAAGLEAGGRGAEALETYETAAAYARRALEIAPRHALLARELLEATLASARLDAAPKAR